MAALGTIIGYGLAASRPAAGTPGALYYASDTDALSRDNGTTWDTLTPGGGGGASDAADVTYDHTSSGLAATDVQAAIDEVAASVGGGGTPEAWHTVGGGGEPAFAHSWTNFGSGNQDAQFRLEGDIVRVRGLIAGGSVGQSVFTLPTGYRPPADVYLAAQCGFGVQFGALTIRATGAVEASAGANGFFAITCAFSVTA